MSYQLFIGTYTGGNPQSDSLPTGSQGIYSYQYDDKKHTLSYTGAYGNNEIDPGFIESDGTYLYTENERKDMGTVRTFQINQDGSLELIHKHETEGSKCAHICIDPYGPYLFATSYAAGSLFVTKRNADGSLTETDFIQHYGHSIVPVRQDSPRAHSSRVMPNSKGLVVPDLGTDKLYLYNFDRENGKLSPNSELPFLSVQAGEGPRHFVFHPNGKYGYMNTEIGNTVYVYRVNDKNNTLTQIQHISLLPDNFKGTSHSAEILISKDGRFLYCCNRGHDTISIFKISPEKGILTLIDHQKSFGKGPRHICFGPEERTLFIANKESNSVSILERNPNDGSLGQVLHTETVPAPSCVLLLNIKGDHHASK